MRKKRSDAGVPNPNRRNNNAKPLAFPVYASMAQMSADTGIPMSVLTEAKKSGCMFVRHSRADSGEFIRWFFRQNLDPEEQVNWTERSKRAEALTREVNLERLRKRVIDFKFVEKWLGDLVNSLFFGELERLAQEFPPGLAGKEEVQIRVECRRQIDNIKRGLAKRLEAWSQLIQVDPNEESEEEDEQ